MFFSNDNRSSKSFFSQLPPSIGAVLNHISYLSNSGLKLITLALAAQVVAGAVNPPVHEQQFHQGALDYDEWRNEHRQHKFRDKSNNWDYDSWIASRKRFVDYPENRADYGYVTGPKDSFHVKYEDGDLYIMRTETKDFKVCLKDNDSKAYEIFIVAKENDLEGSGSVTTIIGDLVAKTKLADIRFRLMDACNLVMVNPDGMLKPLAVLQDNQACEVPDERYRQSLIMG